MLTNKVVIFGDIQQLLVEWINPCTFFRLQDSLNLIVDNISLPIVTERSLFLQSLKLEKSQLLALLFYEDMSPPSTEVTLSRSEFVLSVFPCSLDSLFPGRTSVVGHYTLSLEIRHI